ncbi:MAG: GGDEF domain-containing protein, partial [Oscillospiraceae bacterium]|nr:GGDEF domain-containing protein [Oscillospiraceae bacterium]
MIMLDLDKLKQDEHGQETFEEGQIIISEGDVSDNKMYVLLDGVANVYKGYGTQGEIKIAELQPGDFFGEMSLFLNKERTATIIAGTEVSAIVVNNMSINDFLIRQPEAAYVFMQTLCKRLDITNINSSELQTTANTDALTGVYNRRFFMDSAKSLIAAASRNEKISYVILFDIDFFKKVNDTYGHQAGDDVLKEFASVANTNVRSGDLFAR